MIPNFPGIYLDPNYDSKIQIIWQDISEDIPLESITGTRLDLKDPVQTVHDL